MIPRDTALTALLPLLVTAIATIAIFAGEVRAEERDTVSCELEGLVRQVTLRADPAPDRACDVFHEKPDGTSEVLWAARADPDHCEPRYEQFVRQLVSRGWRCDRAETGTRATRTAPSGSTRGAESGANADDAAGVAVEKETASCTFDGLIRRVTLRANPSPNRVCDVLYEKPDVSDAGEVLWAARHDPDYCEPEYERFVRRLVSDGWTCDRAQKPDERRNETARAARSDGAAITGAAAKGLLIDPLPRPSAGVRADGRSPSAPDGAGVDEPAAVIRTASDAQAARRVLRDWCIAKAGDGTERIETHCNCISDTMADYGLSKRDAQAITDGLPAPLQVQGDTIAPDASRSQRLNALAMNYGYVVDFCR